MPISKRKSQSYKKVKKAAGKKVKKAAGKKVKKAAGKKAGRGSGGKGNKQGLLKVPAIEMSQGRNNNLYSFVVDGKLVPKFASISPIARSKEDGSIRGYQRTEVDSHIKEIRRYVESKGSMIPNAIVIAFDSRVSFKPSVEQEATGSGRFGYLHIPLGCAKGESLPGWIVDGQQRTAAIREANVKAFNIFVTAFIAVDSAEQREQFILVNSTKPLPKGLLHELIPETSGKLPLALERRRFPSELLDWLNKDETSPFCGRINRPTNPDGNIKDNSVLTMLENSLSYGALYIHRDPKTGRGDIEAMIRILNKYWNAVAKVFPKAWNLPPDKSKLTGGAGINSMGSLMNAIFDRFSDDGEVTQERYEKELGHIKPVCKWTSGVWDFGPDEKVGMKGLQNTAHHKKLLANYLMGEYRRRSSTKRR